MNETTQKLPQIAPVQAFTVLVSSLGVITALANLWIAANIAPFVGDIRVLAEEVHGNTARDEREHPQFVSQNEFKLHNVTVERIEDKIDSLIRQLN